MTAHLRRASAANLAAWHDVSVRAIGLRPSTTDAWWTCPTPAPNIFHTAISLRPARDAADATAMRDELRAHLDDPDNAHVSVCDNWDELALDALDLTRRTEGPWCAQLADPSPPPVAPTPLEIRTVRDRDDLATFERTVVEGFGARLPIAPFDIHGVEILDDPSMHILLGLDPDDARALSVAMAYEAADVVGIYGVATIPRARRHGHAEAITRAALQLFAGSDHPAVLQPSPQALPIYRRLGFVDIGWFSHWT